MKLVLAIINSDDAGAVAKALTKNGFSSTRLATTGGFLMSKNVTIMVGVDEEKVSDVIEIIKEFSHSRSQIIPTSSGAGRRRHHFCGGCGAVPAGVSHAAECACG